jgi:hypothetical protein
MPTIIKLCLVVIIWAIGVYFGLSARSDPAGQAWAQAIPIITALVLSSPLAFWISRTPVSGNGWRRKALRTLRYGPLAIAVSPVILLVVGCLIAFVLYFIKFVLVLGVAGLGFWIFVVCRKRKRARQGEPLLKPRAEVVVAQLPVRQPIPVEPVAKPQKPPRVRKPVYGVLAWVLPLLAMPVGYLLGYLVSRGNHYEGFQAWGVVGLALVPLLIALCVSPILAMISLYRRERFPGLAIALLALYVIGLALSFPLGGLTPLLVLAVSGLILARWLFKRHRRKCVASGIAPTHGKSRMVSSVAWLGKQTKEIAGMSFHMIIALKRRITAREDIMGVTIGVAVTPVVLILAMVSMGAGHGDYLWAKLFFPVLTLVMVAGAGVFVVPFALVQYPYFGWYMGRCISKRRFVRLAVVLLILQVIPMLFMFTMGRI